MKMLYLIPFWALCALFTVIKPGGVKRLVAENPSLRKQLQVLNRGHKRSPNLSTFERIFFALCAKCTNKQHLLKFAIAIKSATILKFHRAMVKRKYSMMFSNKSPKKTGPKWPSREIINHIVGMKHRNRSCGYRRIAMQIINIFGLDIDKDVVRRVLRKHYKPSNDDGPSWLNFIGHIAIYMDTHYS